MIDGQSVIGSNTIILPNPHAGQRAVMLGAKRFNWLAAGRRWRKTTLAMSIAVEAAIHGGTYIWGAPTFDQVRIGFNETKQACAKVARFNMSRMTATFPNGRIIYRSLDNPDNVRGFTADGVIMDEAAFIKPSAWLEVLRPMLMDTMGWSWGIGTPFGRNWFYYSYMESDARGDSARWQIPTLGVKLVDGELVRWPHPLENPDINFGEIYALWRQMPERVFRQEILAEFMESGGGVFRGVAALATAEQLEHGEAGAQYVIGADWGRSNDFTVFVVVDILRGQVVAHDRFTDIDYDIQTGRLRAMHKRFPGPIIAEYNSMGGPIVERLQAEGLPITGFVTTNKTKELVIRGLEAAFENREIRIPDDEIMIAELQAYEQERLVNGWRFSAPEGMHDDTVIALALAWSGVRMGVAIESMDNFIF